MEEGIIWIIIAVAVLVLGFAMFHYFLPGLLWLFTMGAVIVTSALDQAFSASLCPHAPWVMWIVWGGLIGGSMGFWTIAPAYGLREKRAMILLAPYCLMTIVALLRAVVAA
jgi:hypothetical protein